jgi:hypothetical protein
MKTLIAFALALTLTQAYANNPETQIGSPAETGTATGTYGSEAPPANDTSGVDTVRTHQSSTRRGRDTDKLNRHRRSRMEKDAATTSCVDREGKTYGTSDAGFVACRDSMRTK